MGIIAIFAVLHFLCIFGAGRLATAFVFPECLVGPGKHLRCFWVGFATLIFFLQLWHLARPVDAWASAIFTLAGLTGAVMWWRGRERGERLFARQWLGPLIALPVIFWLWLLAFGPIRQYDSGLYHFNAIRWANEHAIVPGLGNLHHRLAFNQTEFLYIAFLNSGLPSIGHHLGNFIVFAGLALEVSGDAVRWVRSPSQRSLPFLLGALLLPVLAATLAPFDSACAWAISSPSPDPVVFGLGMVAFLYFVRFLYRAKRVEAGDCSSGELTTLLLLCATILTIKLSFLVFGGLMVTIALSAFARSPIAKRTWPWRPLLFGLVILLVWATRGIVTSGYPAFPLTAGGIRVDWKVPESEARLEELWIESWAREPGSAQEEVLADWDWFGPWLDRLLDDVSTTRPVSLAAAGFIIFGLFQASPHCRTADWKCTLPMLPLIGGIAFWFYKAPDPRFAGALFWCLAVWTWTLLAAYVLPIAPPRISRWAARTSLIFGVVYPACCAVTALAGDFQAFPIPKARMQEYATQSGLRLLIPVGEPQPWDSPLPATPYPRPDLILRGEALSSGFRLAHSETSGF